MNGLAPVGFKSRKGRGRGLLRSCLGFKSAPVMIFLDRRGFVFICVCVCVCVCGLWFVLEVEGG